MSEKKPKLRVCPFCGNAPGPAWSKTITRNSMNSTVYYTHCITPGCPIFKHPIEVTTWAHREGEK